MENNTKALKFYEIDRILNKRTIRKGRDMIIKYLIKWKEYKFEYDRWYNIKVLKNVTDLIKDYEEKLLRI